MLPFASAEPDKGITSKLPFADSLATTSSVTQAAAYITHLEDILASLVAIESSRSERQPLAVIREELLKVVPALEELALSYFTSPSQPLTSLIKKSTHALQDLEPLTLLKKFLTVISLQCLSLIYLSFN